MARVFGLGVFGDLRKRAFYVMRVNLTTNRGEARRRLARRLKITAWMRDALPAKQTRGGMHGTKQTDRTPAAMSSRVGVNVCD